MCSETGVTPDNKLLNIVLSNPIQEPKLEESKELINLPEEKIDFVGEPIDFQSDEILPDNPFLNEKQEEKPVIPEKIIKKEKKKEKPTEKVIPLKKELVMPEVVTSVKDSTKIERPETAENKNTAVEQVSTSKTVLTKEQQDENSKYLAKVLKIFEKNKKYPSEARKRNLQGKIIVAFSIGTDGTTSNVVAKTVTPEQLANAAEELVRKTKLPSPPEHWKSSAIIELPIVYKLR